MYLDINSSGGIIHSNGPKSISKQFCKVEKAAGYGASCVHYESII